MSRDKSIPGAPDEIGARRRYRMPLWLKVIGWHLNGTAGRSIRYRIKLLECRYVVGVALAKRCCRGNRYGEHVDAWAFPEPLGGSCFCARTRRRFDYIPF